MCLRDTGITAIYTFLTVLVLSFYLQPSHAVREGTANANIMIKRYERDRDFAKAALWREAAADCLKIISIPVTEISIRYHLRHGKNSLAEMSRGELADIKNQRKYHLKGAKANWEKLEADATSSGLDVERKKIAQFIATWTPIYPDRFYDYGIYPSFFKAQQEVFKRRGDYAAALNLEADAAEMCADQYNEITIAYFQREAERASNEGYAKVAEGYRQRVTQYEQVRDTHRRWAARLRALAERRPKAWPTEADKRQIVPPETKTQLTPQQAIRIANTDARLQEILAAHKGVHEYAWFQGFAWTVSYYNHGWGNLAIALVNDKTGTVVDVLNSIGNLEAREWDESTEEESGALRLGLRQVEEIARRHDEVASYFKAHPKARLSAVFSGRYRCWIVEVIEGNKEVGFVSVSDQTGVVLEVEIEQ